MLTMIRIFAGHHSSVSVLLGVTCPVASDSPAPPVSGASGAVAAADDARPSPKISPSQSHTYRSHTCRFHNQGVSSSLLRRISYKTTERLHLAHRPICKLHAHRPPKPCRILFYFLRYFDRRKYTQGTKNQELPRPNLEVTSFLFRRSKTPQPLRPIHPRKRIKPSQAGEKKLHLYMSSPAEVSSVSMGTRPYRCQKRQKPCDHCRERKLKCQTDGGPPPCQRCVRVNIPCTFVGRPRRRPASAAAAPPQPPESSHRHDESSSCEPLSDQVSSEQQQHAYHRSVSAGIVDGVTQPPDVTHSSHPMSGHFPDGANSEVAAGVVSGGPSLDYTDAGGPVGTCEPAAASVAVPTQALNTPTSSSFHNGGGRVSTQLSQTMDQIDGHSIMLLGASSESDPWLLRHCRFDQLGLRSVHKMYFRNAGGVPTKDKIPVHFIISDNKYLTHPMMMMQGDGGDVSVAFRAELNQLVPPSYGVRLICL